MDRQLTAEEQRLAQNRERSAHWNRWGPFLSERQWGTVREDYSPDGTAWTYLPHDHARSRAYRWGEDGLGGICDRHQLICFSWAFWNGRDPILKERLFGLTGPEGNHGEDVKEYYFFLDNTPTHSWMRWLYKYPQAAYPYADLVAENGRRGRLDPEYELLDTGVFAEDRYFDITVEYAKHAPDDILIRLTAINRGPEAAELHLLPMFWFRNTWAWNPGEERPVIKAAPALSLAPSAEGEAGGMASVIESVHPYYAGRWLLCEGAPPLLFTENETNSQRLYGIPNATPHVKDAFDAYVVHGDHAAVNPAQTGTRASAYYPLRVEPGKEVTLRLRLVDYPPDEYAFSPEFDSIMQDRRREADEFYATVIPAELSADARSVHRQAFAGLLWSKQFYHYEVERWLEGDPGQPPPPSQRKSGRNHTWKFLYNADVLSMPDTWEYPWYAAWDLAFHCLTLALVDADFAKEQLILLLREWYMRPNGQLPAYEWAFGDVNPPVHAWAAWRVYRIEQRRRGVGDVDFLKRVFNKLTLNFTWWVNREDAGGNNVFEGGFLGLDNIGLFDRSAALPTGGYIEQSDGTSWMATYCLNLLTIALELARIDPAYEDVASKFFEHFAWIAEAMNNLGGEGIQLWDEEDGFYYDVLHLPDGSTHKLKVHSMVGLIPLFAVETLDEELLERLPGFRKRMEWFLENRPSMNRHVDRGTNRQGKPCLMFSVLDRARLRRVLTRMLDESEFLSPHGIRSLSAHHREHPYTFPANGTSYQVDYEPAESTTGLFGGNSNWRGPVWFPPNYLIIESLQKFDYFFGSEFLVDFPTRSGQGMDLWNVAAELSRRLTRLFLRGEDGRRPVYGGTEKFQTDPHWRDLILFHEYFHGDNGAGLGASHQTGWTALVAKLLQQSGE